MIVVNAIVSAAPEAIEALKPAIAEMERASRAEPGCEDYTFSVELNDPGVLRITERWSSMAALEAHFAAPHMGTFRAAMAAHPPKSVAATFYEAKEIAPPGS